LSGEDSVSSSFDSRGFDVDSGFKFDFGLDSNSDSEVCFDSMVNLVPGWAVPPSPSSKVGAGVRVCTEM
jgi:hypothetical protein